MVDCAESVLAASARQADLATDCQQRSLVYPVAGFCRVCVLNVCGTSGCSSRGLKPATTLRRSPFSTKDSASTEKTSFVRDLPDEITAVKKSDLSEFPWTLAIIAVRYQIEMAKSFTRMWTEINLNQQRGDIRIMQTDAEGPERNELRSLDSENPPLMTPEEVATALRVHRSWVYAHQQEIPGLVRLGHYVRFRRVAIMEFLCEKFPCQ